MPTTKGRKRPAHRLRAEERRKERIVIRVTTNEKRRITTAWKRTPKRRLTLSEGARELLLAACDETEAAR